VLKVLIIGDRDVSLPFRTMGIEANFAPSREEGRKILLEAIKKDYGIIFLVESIAQECLDIIAEISETRSLPVITIIPDLTREVPRAAEERLRQLIRRAVGIELPE
jgi:vacuolar-type H+-ATPase subunit F/Vma7